LVIINLLKLEFTFPSPPSCDIKVPRNNIVL